MKVVVQKWEESERGWGCRPDGYSLHLTEEDRKSFIAGYWAMMPKAVPDEYSRPNGTPYIADVEPTDLMMAALQQQQGFRSYERVYPGSGGADGWVHTKR